MAPVVATWPVPDLSKKQDSRALLYIGPCHARYLHTSVMQRVLEV